MKSLKLFSLLISLMATFCPKVTKGQIFEPFNARYIYMPASDVASADDESFESAERTDLHIFETVVRFPVKFGKSGAFVVPDITYKRYFQSYNSWPNESTQPNHADHYRLVLKGIIPINDKWNILALGGIAQGLDKGVGFDFGNNFYRIGGGFLKDLKSGNQFGIALQYISETKIIVPIPVYKGASKNGRWQFDVEGPRVVIERLLSKGNNDSRLRFEQKFDNDRISYASDVSEIADSYNYTHLNFSLGLSQKIKGPVFANLSGGLSPLYLMTQYDNGNSSIESLRFDIQPTVSLSIYVSVNPNDYVD